MGRGGADYTPQATASPPPPNQKDIYTSVLHVLYRIFHAVVVFGLFNNLLFNSVYKFSRNLLNYGLLV